MAYIEPRYNKNGELLHYRLNVSGGLNWKGQQIRKRIIWKPPRPNMSKKQLEREAMAAAFKFEEAIQAGYEIDKVKRFCDYADYVLDLKDIRRYFPKNYTTERIQKTILQLLEKFERNWKRRSLDER